VGLGQGRPRDDGTPIGTVSDCSSSNTGHGVDASTLGVVALAGLFAVRRRRA
jgi:MYXO-CTERM domain-containing protein